MFCLQWGCHIKSRTMLVSRLIIIISYVYPSPTLRIIVNLSPPSMLCIEYSICYLKVFWLSGTGKIFVNYSRITQCSEASTCLNSPGLPHVKIYCKVWSEVVAGIFNSHSIQWEWMNKREIWVTYCVILESFENSELNLPWRKRRTNM